MSPTRKKLGRYRKFSFLSDIGGIKNAIGELRGLFHPKQPPLNKSKVGAPNDFDEAWFAKTIEDKIANHPENAKEFPFEGERIFEKPLVGFVRGDDPIFEEYKKIIGPHHFTPAEIMKWQAENNGVPAPAASEIGVVVFVMPMTKITRDDNAAMKDWPSERWAQTRLLGEIFSQTMVREIVTHLMDNGVLAVAPDVTSLFRKQRYPTSGWGSPWSHRHAAYAAGLGSFGMHDFFISDAGSAHRMGSFIANLKLEPNRSRTADIHANCLQYQGIKCLKCASRCPVRAIDERGHDKEKCYQRVAKSLSHCNKNYHIFIYGCGLCSTAVPCESSIPAAILKRNESKKR